MTFKDTWNHIRSQNHMIPSPLANKLGVPVLRTIFANTLIQLKRFKYCRPRNNHEKDLIKNGFVVIPNFLPTEDFKKLKQEFDLLMSQSEHVNSGDKGLIKINIRPIRYRQSDELPAMQKFSKNEQLIRLISVGEGKKPFDHLTRFNLENYKFVNPNKDFDQTVPFHADVHFHSHKVFLYMSDVTEKSAPFTYCKKSHKNTFDRLWFELRRGQLKDAHKETWRIDDHLDKKFFKDYFEKKILKQEYKVISPANTLVVANVHGFHRRGVASEGARREMIRATFRYNPLGPVGERPHIFKPKYS